MEKQICVIQIFRLIILYNIVMLDTLNYALGKTQRIIEQMNETKHKLYTLVNNNIPVMILQL